MNEDRPTPTQDRSPAYEPPCAQELDTEHGPAEAAAMVIITEITSG